MPIVMAAATYAKINPTSSKQQNNGLETGREKKLFLAVSLCLFKKKKKKSVLPACFKHFMFTIHQDNNKTKYGK